MGLLRIQVCVYCIVALIIIDYLFVVFFNILEPSPMNRSHSSHSATPQYSQSPHASYNNMQPSAYNTVN